MEREATSIVTDLELAHSNDFIVTAAEQVSVIAAPKIVRIVAHSKDYVMVVAKA